MRYAIVSDIHANLPAWKAVLRDIRANGADEIICLGDVVGYGPMPRPVLDDVRENVTHSIIGNHDAVVGGRYDEDDFSDSARAVIQWTRSQLPAEAAEYFAQLPTDISGDSFVAAHAEIGDPERFGYIEDESMARESFAACDATMIFVGHTHHAGIYIMDTVGNAVHPHAAADFSAAPGMRYIVNVGSVGDPRDRDDIRSCYCLYDIDTNEVTYRRVPFDLAAYRLSLKQSGLSIYPYFLSSVDGHPEVIPIQDWKPRIVVRHARNTASVTLHNSGNAIAGIVSPVTGAPHDRLSREELLRRQQAALVKSRENNARAERDKLDLAAKLRAAQQAALARSGTRNASGETTGREITPGRTVTDDTLTKAQLDRQELAAKLKAMRLAALAAPGSRASGGGVPIKQDKSGIAPPQDDPIRAQKEKQHWAAKVKAMQQAARARAGINTTADRPVAPAHQTTRPELRDGASPMPDIEEPTQAAKSTDELVLPRPEAGTFVSTNEQTRQQQDTLARLQEELAATRKDKHDLEAKLLALQRSATTSSAGSTTHQEVRLRTDDANLSQAQVDPIRAQANRPQELAAKLKAMRQDAFAARAPQTKPGNGSALVRPDSTAGALPDNLTKAQRDRQEISAKLKAMRQAGLAAQVTAGSASASGSIFRDAKVLSARPQDTTQAAQRNKQPLGAPQRSIHQPPPPSIPVEPMTKDALARKHKAFLARSREDQTKAQKEKQDLVAKLMSAQQAALARRQTEEQR
ncbi:MAG: metallophosphoesterase family protein [bacterium]